MNINKNNEVSMSGSRHYVPKIKSLFEFTCCFSVLFLFTVVANSLADIPDSKPAVQEIGVVEHLGDYIPLDLSFVDSKGHTVILKDVIDKPTVLSLVYFNCPGLCSPLLSGKVDVLDRMTLTPGKDFKALTISFNPSEGPDLAREKKDNYFRAFRRKQFPEKDWLWLTGDSATIKRLTDAVGFMYKKEGDTYLHPGVLTVLSAKGKISRYLRGIEFQPFDLKMAITEASEGRTGPTVSKLLLYCFSYDPKGKSYVLDFTKVFGSAFLFVLVILIAYLTYQGTYKRKKELRLIEKNK